MTKSTFKKGAKVERWEAALNNPQSALKGIGALMVAESQRAFREQKHGRTKWEPRAPINVYGIIADFTQGKTPPKRRFDNSKTLRDTGRLSSAGGIVFRVNGTTEVEVGTNLDYAHVLHFGGPIESKPITRSVRGALWKWLKPKDKSLKDSLGWLLNRKFIDETLQGEVPPRPFIGITDDTIAEVHEIIGVSIMEVE